MILIIIAMALFCIGTGVYCGWLITTDHAEVRELRVRAAWYAANLPQGLTTVTVRGYP